MLLISVGSGWKWHTEMVGEDRAVDDNTESVAEWKERIGKEADRLGISLRDYARLVSIRRHMAAIRIGSPFAMLSLQETLREIGREADERKS